MFGRVVVCGFLLSATLPARSAHAAASRNATNRCADAVRTLRSGPSLHEVIEEVSDEEVEHFAARVMQMDDAIRRAKTTLAGVTPDELRSIELSECRSELEAREKYVAAANERIVALRARHVRKASFFKEERPYDASVRLFEALLKDKASDVLNGADLAAATKILADLAALEEVCKKDFAGTHDRMIPGGFKEPENVCGVATGRAVFMGRAIQNRFWFVEGYGNYATAFPALIEALKKPSAAGYMDPWIAALLVDGSDFRKSLDKQTREWSTTLAIPVESPWPKLELQLNEIRSLVRALAPTLHLQDGPRDAKLEALAQVALARLFPAARVKKSAMDAADFTVSHNELGVPTGRYRSGHVLFQLSSADLCQERQFSYVEPHLGGGKYQPANSVKLLGATRFLTCSN